MKEAVEKMGLVCDWKTEELKDHTKVTYTTTVFGIIIGSSPQGRVKRNWSVYHPSTGLY